MVMETIVKVYRLERIVIKQSLKDLAHRVDGEEVSIRKFCHKQSEKHHYIDLYGFFPHVTQ